MKNPLFSIIAGIMAFVGLVWIGQGLNLIKGSFMTGDITWTYIGLVVVLLAAVLFWVGNRRSVKKK